jgi:predicted acyl esterase
MSIDKILSDLPKTKTKIVEFGGKEFEVIYTKARTPVSAEFLTNIPEGVPQHAVAFSFAPDLETCTYVLEDNILVEQDVPFTLSDGTVIYSDIYRPLGETNIPAIVSWSFFGKRPGAGMNEWQIMGVTPGTVSNMAKFESPDPAYWCRQGYAIANVDTRGTGHSQGDVNMFGSQDGRDGAEYVEWLAKRHWCNGKVGMGGNSGVAMTHWWIAAEQPPSLVCIAPWEGTSDLYRESIFEGGIPALGFNNFIQESVTGEGYIENMSGMGQKYPFMNEYWEDKIPKFEKIRIPAYVTASWSHFHLRGSINGFRKIKSRKKWLRTHREFEWPDSYDQHNIAELKRFYDRYLKDIRNGWESTPRVRMEVMDAYDFDYQSNRPEKQFPLARTKYTKLYLDAANASMSFEPVANESKASYDGETEETTFDITFNEETEITGFIKLRLWVEAEGNDDMDLFITMQKLAADGSWLPTNVLDEPHPGAWGKMRASRRKLDEKKSTDYQPVQSHLVDEKLSPGEIVPVDIEIVPQSRIWHKGEQLRIRVAGRYIRTEWFEPFSWETNNKGKHIIHTGGKYDSFLQVPIVPPRYKSGDYIYR